jgi:hypothetical protein
MKPARSNAEETPMAVLHDSHFPVTGSELPWAIRQGAIGGIIAGIVFAAFEMIAAALMMGWDAFFMPLRMIGGIALGPAALEPSYSLLAAGFAGLIVHVILAAIYGAVFAAVFGGLRSAAADIALGAAFGLVLWVINFYVIAPLAYPWFLEANPVVQAIAHIVFFGAVLGWYLSAARRRAEVPAP